MSSKFRFINVGESISISHLSLQVLIQCKKIFCSIDLIPEEGGTNVELISGGRTVEVTTSNVYDYVRKYAEYRMVKSQEKALQVDIFAVFFEMSKHFMVAYFTRKGY